MISGFYFPIRSLNFWVAAGASLIPLTLGLDAMRQLAFSEGESLGLLTIEVEIAMLVGLSVIFLVAAKFFLDKMETLAVRDGKITDARK